MASEDGNLLAALPRKVLRRFYEPLLLLEALGEVRGERIRLDSTVDDAGTNQRKIRRSFADGIAYVCAYRTDGDYVTAAALERTPEGIIVWLAANTTVEEKVVEFVGRLLNELQHISQHENAHSRQRAGTQSIDHIRSMVIGFNALRITHYYRLVVQKFASPCLEIVRNARQLDGSDPELARLQTWIELHFLENTQEILEGQRLEDIVLECHGVRSSPPLTTLIPFAGQGQSRAHEFEQLYKLLCKLGKHVTVTNKLVHAAVNLPQDFVDGFRIEVIPASRPKRIPLLPQEATFSSTVGRMFSQREDQARFLSRLESIYGTDGFTEYLQRRARNVRTRVHAELLLMDHFDRNGGPFLDGNDKYIGCSKPACYLCYAYINSHPRQYSLPASHQKIYVSWRLPDVYADDLRKDGLLDRQKKILLDMIEVVRRDLVFDVENRTSRLPFHADSTAGMTTTRDERDHNSPSSIVSLEEARTDVPDGSVYEPHSFGEESWQSESDSQDLSDEGGVSLRNYI